VHFLFQFYGIVVLTLDVVFDVSFRETLVVDEGMF
jgi:hypothetical protein